MNTDTGKSFISCRDLCKEYSMGEEIVHALRNVSLDIAAGEYVSIMGPSGSGKSTFMNLLGALDTPTSGELIFNNLNLGEQNSDRLALFRNLTIGFVFQQFNLLAKTTALENVKLPLLYSHANGIDKDARARQCLEQVGLADRMHHLTTQLSGGQQQRVAIARALVNQPSAILADEPTGALDTHTSIEIMELFQRLNDTGITVIIVTHDQEVANYTRRNLMFRDGCLIDDVQTNTPGQVLV